MRKETKWIVETVSDLKTFNRHLCIAKGTCDKQGMPLLTLQVAQPFHLKEYDRGQANRDHFFTGTNDEIEDFLQALMDHAWRSGLRPTALKHFETELYELETAIAKFKKGNINDY